MFQYIRHGQYQLMNDHRYHILDNIKAQLVEKPSGVQGRGKCKGKCDVAKTGSDDNIHVPRTTLYYSFLAAYINEANLYFRYFQSEIKDPSSRLSILGRLEEERYSYLLKYHGGYSKKLIPRLLYSMKTMKCTSL